MPTLTTWVLLGAPLPTAVVSRIPAPPAAAAVPGAAHEETGAVPVGGTVTLTQGAGGRGATGQEMVRPGYIAVHNSANYPSPNLSLSYYNSQPPWLNRLHIPTF